MLAYLILLQSVSGPALPTPRALRVTGDCSPGRTTDPDAPIIVCGTRQETFRLRPLPEKYVQPTIPKAEIGVIGKVRMAAETEAATLAGGATSKRAMVRFKVPF